MTATQVTQELRAISTALRQLQRSFDKLAPAIAVGRAASSVVPRRKLQLSPARRSALKLQGQYVGYMRGLEPRQKAEVKRIRAAKGVRAAIATAKRLAA
jgi:hypothetical protein